MRVGGARGSARKRGKKWREKNRHGLARANEKPKGDGDDDGDGKIGGRSECAKVHVDKKGIWKEERTEKGIGGGFAG
jgi:hypothetical protein